MPKKAPFNSPRKKKKKDKIDDNEESDDFSPLKRTLGVFCAMSSCIFFAFSSLLVKLLQEIPPQEVVFFRSLVQVIFVLPPLIYNEIPVVGDAKHLPFLCVRGVAGTLALCCQFYAFQHMPLADATVIVFSSPIFTGVMAHFLLGEAWGLFDALATLLCFTGVVLIARPTFLFTRPIESASRTTDWQQITASLVALCGAILTSIALIAIRKLQRVNVLVPVFYVGLSSVVLTVGAILASGSFQSVICGRSHEWFLLGLGFCGLVSLLGVGFQATLQAPFINRVPAFAAHTLCVLIFAVAAISNIQGGQALLTKSLQLEKAGVVALVRTLDIALAFILQLLFLDYTANVYSIVGAALVLGCNLLVILNRAGLKQNKEVAENYERLPDERKSLMGTVKQQFYGKMLGRNY